MASMPPSNGIVLLTPEQPQLLYVYVPFMVPTHVPSNAPLVVITVSVVLPEVPLKVAMMTAEPAPMPAARPLGPTVATEVVPDAQVTDDVMSYVEPSEYLPVAVN
jgi:hypothetical protein